MGKIWLLVFGYLFLAVGGDDTDAPEVVDAPEDEAEAPEDDSDETEQDAGDSDADGDEPEKPAARSISRAQQAIIDARRRAQEAEKRAERAEREAAEARQRANPPQPSADQRLYEQEETVLRDPNSTEMQRWYVNSNRTLRQTQQEAAAARLQSADLADRAEFRMKAADDPRIKQYAERVETELAKMRAQGQSAPREAIYTFLLGQDVRNGKVIKTAAAGKPKGALPDRERGKPAGVKSDVSGKNRQSERDKLRKRLDGINI